jgi:alkaline phosphatase D
MEPLKIWRTVIKSDPDAWIWLGDMAYVDDTDRQCDSGKEDAACLCQPTWLHQPPKSCGAGDTDYALNRWTNFLNMEEYSSFLDFMCPGARSKVKAIYRLTYYKQIRYGQMIIQVEFIL